MFIIEKLVRDHEARNEAWEAARQKWLDTHEYYSRSDYEDSHPKPGHWIKVAAQTLFIGFLVAAVVGTIVTMVVHSDHHKTDKPKTNTTSQKKDAPIKVGDKVQVVYGDFKDSVGEVVKVGNDDAIIKLTNSTYTHAMADADNRTGGQDNGSLLSVDDLDNLVPYKEVK